MIPLTLLLDASSSYLRLAFRAYFTFAFLSLGFLGDRCLALRVQRNLACKKRVPLTLMTGWLTNMSLLSAVSGFRKLPGGRWFGTAMIASSVLSLASDLAVSGLVRTVNIASRCPFGTGLVVPPTFTANAFWPIPPNNGAPYFVAAQAQLTSAANDGLVGIYWKVNRDLRFAADKTDVVGGWDCADVSDDIEYEADTTPDAIVTDLERRGMLYTDNVQFCSSNYGSAGFSHLIALSSSVGEEIGLAFDVRASIDLTANGPDPKIMKTFLCTMKAPQMEWVLEKINSTATLKNWCLGLQGNVYDGSGTGANNNSGAKLEEYLNSMIMVAAGNNYLLSSAPTNGDSAGTTQGCRAQRTSVPLEIIILFLVVTVGVTAMAVYLMILSCLPTECNGSIRNETPNDLLGWMTQAVRESFRRDGYSEAIKLQYLKRWGFGHTPDGTGLGVLPLGDRKNAGQYPGEELLYHSAAINEETELRRF